MQIFLPEGQLISTSKNRVALSSEHGLTLAMESGQILEGEAVLCDSGHNLIVKMGEFFGFLPRQETALGIKEGTVKEIAILSRVNKVVCFVVTDIHKDKEKITPILSRVRVQRQCLDHYLYHTNPGDILSAKVTYLTPFGAFVDIGCGVTSLITIDNISVSRISHPSDRFVLGQDIYVVIKEKDLLSERLILTHKELLGTWAENAADFSAEQTVIGIVRSLEPYGAFIELTPNLAGLAETADTLKINSTAVVFIKSILPEKMKIKLAVVDTGALVNTPAPLKYYKTSGHMESWLYSPKFCTKIIETIFT